MHGFCIFGASVTAIIAGFFANFAAIMSHIVVFIRSMAYFGDQLVTYPLLYQLHKLYPHHPVTVIAHDPVAQHYEHLPWVHRFVQANSFQEKYRAMPADTGMVIALHHSSEQYALLAAAKRVPQRLGFKAKRVFDFVWSHTHKKDINEYIGLANLRLLNTAKNFDPAKAARGCIEWLASQLTEPKPHSDVVFMVGGGAGAFKRWGVPNYTALADRLIQRMGPHITFTFVLGPAEAEELAQLQAVNRPEFKLLVNQPLAAIAELALRARLIVSNDCGPSHIAQNAGTPYVGLFNEDNPEWFWHRHNTRAVVPDDGSAEIRRITIDQVEQACLAVMA